MGILNNKQKIGAAAVIMGLSILLSRFMGLARDKVISWQFGAGGETDVYFAAFVVPDFLNYLLAGGYLSITLIPLLSRLFNNDEEDAWRFFGTVVTWAALSIGLLSLAAWLAAPWLAPIVAPGFSEEKLVRLTVFLRIILPAQVCFLPGACMSAILYIRNEFAVPALTPLVYNGFILLCGILFPMLGIAGGMEGFCWGVTLGAFFGSFLLPLMAVRSEGLKWRPGLWHRQMKKFLLLALPLMIGQSVVVLDEQFIRIFGSLADEGAVSLLSYARRIMMVPVGVVAQAAGVASFPFLAGLLANGERQVFAETLNKALRNSLIVVFPVVLYMAAVAQPTLGFIFEGGSFSVEKTDLGAPLLQIMLLAVPFWVLQQIIGRGFYADQDTVTPAVVGSAATVVCVPLYLWLTPRFGAPAVASLTVASVGLYAMALLGWGTRRFGRDIIRNLGRTAFKSIAVGLPAFGTAWACSRFLLSCSMPNGTGLLLRQFLAISLGGVAFLIVWLMTARAFSPEFIAVLLSPFQKKLGRLLRKG